MERKYESAEKALEIAKEAMWLAWTACDCSVGMGVFQANDAVKKDKVWEQAYEMGDYSGRGGMDKSEVDADYVFGRMLKLRFHIKGDTLQLPDDTPRGDYQGWCYKFKSYADLFDAAEQAAMRRDNVEAK